MHNRDKTHCKKGHEFSAENTTFKLDGARLCKTCNRDKARMAYHSNAEYRASVKLASKLHQEKHRTLHNGYKAKHKKKNNVWGNFCERLRRHGLTLDQYHAINEAQNFVCAICKQDSKLSIDHDHNTGKVRGLLCQHCNFLVGLGKDDPVIIHNAAIYVTKHSGK